MTLVIFALSMGGGIKQARPLQPFVPDKSRPFVAATLPIDAPLPELVVFDLDNTLWTPELYTLRKLPNYDSAGPPGPVAGKDVWLINGAAAALHELAACERWTGVRVAVASRTNKGLWAHQLLSTFEIPGCSGRPLIELLTGGVEIYPGSKLAHFKKLHEETGVAYERMLFFDDAADGPYGNCAPVAGLGVLSAHCPDGLTASVWASAVTTFAQRSAEGQPTGMVLRPSSSGGNGGGNSGGGSFSIGSPGSSGGVALGTGGKFEQPATGHVVKFFEGKGFGFIEVGGSAGNPLSGTRVFFHESKLKGGTRAGTRLLGASVRVRVTRDPQGRLECSSVEVGEPPRTTPETAPSEGGVELIALPTFSMNMPFAGLLARSIKTLETRNHTMFEGTEGRLALLHVGMRTYPDGGKHRDILRRGAPGEGKAGLDDAQIDRLTQLPEGFSRGQVMASDGLSDERSLSLSLSLMSVLSGDFGLPCRWSPSSNSAARGWQASTSGRPTQFSALSVRMASTWGAT